MYIKMNVVVSIIIDNEGLIRFTKEMELPILPIGSFVSIPFVVYQKGECGTHPIWLEIDSYTFDAESKSLNVFLETCDLEECGYSPQEHQQIVEDSGFVKNDIEDFFFYRTEP